MKIWLKSFGIGLGIVLFVAVTMLMIATLAVFIAGDNAMSLYDLLVGFVIVWFVSILALMPYGSVPLEISESTFFLRLILVWLPISLGVLLVRQSFPLWTFFIGMYISSTCVGYNILVTRKRKASD